MDGVMRTIELVRETAFSIHVYLGHGHLERIYENALVHRLEKLGINVERQVPLNVLDEDGYPLGRYVADLLIGGSVLIEIKTTKSLLREHEAQLLAYLKSCRLEHGLLINFGSFRFEIRKYANFF
jgi:GxxExxY protein